MAQIATCEAAWGRPALLRALERATRFRRFKAADVRAILGAGDGVPTPTAAGAQLLLALPPVTERSLDSYGLAGLGVRA